MSWMSEAIERDKKELQSLFIEGETLEFSFYDLGKTYSKLQLKAIEGKPLEEGKKAVFYFYRDDIYIPFDKRDPDYSGSLVAYDYAGQSYTAKYHFRRNLKKSDTEKLSIHDVLEELYANTRR